MKERNVEIVREGRDFTMVENGQRTDKLVFSKKHDRINGKKMKENDHYLIVFTLDEDGDFRFDCDKRRVMWVNKGTEMDLPECPESETHQEAQFKVRSVSDHTLEVVNKDTDKCLYKFVINMVDKRTNEPVAYDPIYENKNGGLSAF